MSLRSEAELQPRGQHVHVLAATREVELVAVPVGADLDRRGERERSARPIGPAPARLASAPVTLDGGFECRPHVGAAVEPAHLAEDAEALAERNARHEREGNGPGVDLAARGADAAEVGVADLESQPLAHAPAGVDLEAGVLGVALELRDGAIAVRAELALAGAGADVAPEIAAPWRCVLRHARAGGEEPHDGGRGHLHCLIHACSPEFLREAEASLKRLWGGA